MCLSVRQTFHWRNFTISQSEKYNFKSPLICLSWCMALYCLHHYPQHLIPQIIHKRAILFYKSVFKKQTAKEWKLLKRRLLPERKLDLQNLSGGSVVFEQGLFLANKNSVRESSSSHEIDSVITNKGDLFPSTVNQIISEKMKVKSLASSNTSHSLPTCCPINPENCSIAN